MATKKPATKKPATTGPAFPLGDPDGVVRWTPAMLKKVFPRRELAPRAPSVDLAAIARDLAAGAVAARPLFDQGAAAPGADAALHAALAEAHDWLTGDPLARDVSPEHAALAFQLVEVGDCFRAEAFAARLVDLWVARFGLPFALRALCASYAVASAALGLHGGLQVLVPAPKPRRGYGDGPTVSATLPARALVRASHNRVGYLTVDEIPAAVAGTRHVTIFLFDDEYRPWLRLREHLAAAPEAAWEACAAAAEPLRAHPDPVVRHWVAFAFPERPEWAEALARAPGEHGAALQPVLSSCVRDPARLSQVTCEYFFEAFERAAASLLAAAGPRAAPHLVAVGRKTRAAAQARYALALAAQVDTDEAVRALLAHAGEPRVAEALAVAEANFPARVAALR